MRKSFFILTIIFLFISCSSSDNDSGVSSSSTKINPPNWIRGTWMMYDDSLQDEIISLNSGFQFKKDDFCSIIMSTYNCNKEMIKQMNKAGGYTKVEEDKSEDHYYLNITIVHQTVSYEFDRTSSNMIIYNNQAYKKQ